MLYAFYESVNKVTHYHCTNKKYPVYLHNQSAIEPKYHSKCSKWLLASSTHAKVPYAVINSIIYNTLLQATPILCYKLLQVSI